MAKPRWILTADVDNSRTGKRGDSCVVYDQADLDRRTEAAREAGRESERPRGRRPEVTQLGAITQKGGDR
jgi:hypothetical protein